MTITVLKEKEFSKLYGVDSWQDMKKALPGVVAEIDIESETEQETEQLTRLIEILENSIAFDIYAGDGVENMSASCLVTKEELSKVKKAIKSYLKK